MSHHKSEVERLVIPEVRKRAKERRVPPSSPKRTWMLRGSMLAQGTTLWRCRRTGMTNASEALAPLQWISTAWRTNQFADCGANSGRSWYGADQATGGAGPQSLPGLTKPDHSGRMAAVRTVVGPSVEARPGSLSRVSSSKGRSSSRRPTATPALRHRNTVPTQSPASGAPRSPWPIPWECLPLLRCGAAPD